MGGSDVSGVSCNSSGSGGSDGSYVFVDPGTIRTPHILVSSSGLLGSYWRYVLSPSKGSTCFPSCRFEALQELTFFIRRLIISIVVGRSELCRVLPVFCALLGSPTRRCGDSAVLCYALLY